MAKKLYVGNLPFALDSDQLRDLFTPFGEVESARVIADRGSGRSKGFGFVEMVDDAAAAEAIRKLHESTVGSRKIVVNEARPMERGG